MSTSKFIPLASGLQTELDEHLVQPGATLVLENVSGQQTGEAQLRFGADILAAADQATLPAGGELPTPWQLATLEGSLVRFNRAPVPLHTWAAGAQRWVRPTNDNGGIASYRKGPIKVDTSPVFSGTVAGNQVSDPDIAVSGDVIVEVYETLTGTSTGTAVVIMDRATRRPVYTRKTGAGTRAPRVVIVGTRAVVAYESGGNLQVDSYNLSTFTIAQQQTMGAVHANTPIDMRVGAPVAGATNVAILYLDEADGYLCCAVLDATNLTDNEDFFPCDTSGTPQSADLGFAWMQDFGEQGDYSIVYANTDDGLQTLWNVPAPTGGFANAAELHVLDDAVVADLRNIIATTTDALGRYRVLYEIESGFTTRARVAQVIWDSLLPDPGPSDDDPIRSVGIRSKLWLDGDTLYFLSAYAGFANSSYFVLAVPFSITLGTTGRAPLAVAFARDAGGLTEHDNAPSSAAVDSDGAVYIGVTSETRTESISASGTAVGAIQRELAIECVRVRHADEAETELGRPVEYLRSLFVPGGLLGFFDGDTYGTAGFAYPPPFAQYALTTPGGNLDPSAAYRYCYVYSFVDRNGRKWRSSPSFTDTFNTSGTHQQPALTIDTLRLADRGLLSATGGGYQIEVYRTQANATEGFFLVATIANDPTADSVSLTDNVADDSLGEQLYTDGGGLENQLLPSATNVVEHQGRLVVSEAGTGTIWYSTEADFQSGPIFNEALTFDVGDPAEPITGLAVLGQQLFVFKAGNPYVVDGSGANALGQGGSYSPRRIDGGIGCDNPQSIVVADGAVWFRSSSARAGIHRTSGGAPAYVGGGVRAYDGYTITGTAVVRDATEIRFYSLEGTTLVWNWTTRAWSTNTGQACLTATTGYAPVAGVVYARASDEAVLSEATISSADPWREGGVPYLGRSRTPWYQAAGLGGWERIKRIQGVGNIASNGNHTTTIRLYKDFSLTPFQSATLSFDGSDSRWRWELRPEQQKCTAMMIEIEIGPYQAPDVTTSITPEPTPTPPESGMELWLIGSEGVTLDVSDGATDWADQTSHHRDVATTTLGRPTVNPTGINGLPSLTCDSMTMEYTGANIFADGDPRTVLVVCKPSSPTGGYFISFRRSGRRFACGLWKWVDGHQYLYSNCIDTGDNIERTPVFDYTGQDLLIVYEFDGTDLTVRVNGVVLPVNQTDPGIEDGSDTGIAILSGCGAFTGFVGEVGEIMCYSLATAPVDAEAYLANKYGIAI